MNPQYRSIRVLAIIALACLLICLPVAAGDHTVAPTGAEFSSIKDAIDWSIGGDTIRVESGTYTENLRLDKKLTLIGVDTGSGAPVIAPSKAGNVVEILADGCSIQGFTIQNSVSGSGVKLTSGSNSLRHNTIRNNAEGITIVSSDKNTVLNNVITGNNRVGISLESASGNQIDENTVKDNAIGITLDETSRSNIISRNQFSNTQNVVSKSPSTTWSTALTYAYTYLGKTGQNRMGNYWNDYRGKDKNGDGIGDSAYVTGIDSGKIADGTNPFTSDAFPLMDPLEYYSGISAVSSVETVSPAGSQVPVASSTEKPADSLSPFPTRTPQLVSTSPLGPASEPPGSAAPISRFWQDIPLTGVALIVIGVALAGIGGWLFLSRDKDGLAIPSPVPAVSKAALVLKTAVERTWALVTMPSGGTSRGSAEATMASPMPSATDQKNYFPRELENKYREINFIGRGGIAWVFSAYRKTDGMFVAVKIPISFDEVTGKCFLNEIAAWETLRHPNIVEVCAVNILPVPYVEMEFVPSSLEALEKPMPVWKAVRLISGVAEGLRYAHEHGFIHRDIKPHNILLTKDLVPKITDWGMSKVLAADVKKSSVAGFSLSYAAPEQVSPSEFGRTDERTDIYQLGVVFYELVTGSIPFGGESIVEVGNAILREQPVAPSEYNPDAEAVEKIIMKCMEKDPAQRYQSATELIDALQGYLDEDED
ncbi:protein kinase [Methanoregula sp.]|uniref:protein kinase domain-containing protein n=1 Tax=Methanoregula sp. TaxID=2052170 RepID=UPI002373EF79|nr:protein kinase [Methanoregula sp.]MDD1685402.1 protein kinase [Methanoregula sp.]